MVSTQTVRLRWIDSEDRPQMYEGTLPITLGRHEDNTIQLVAQKVSRRHAQLQATDSDAQHNALLVDTSANGTFINGQQVGRALLKNGDEIGIGPFLLTVVIHNTDEDNDNTLFETEIHTADLIDATLSDASIAVLVHEEQQQSLTPPRPALQRPTFPPPAFAQEQIAVESLQESGLPLEETNYLAIGGGLGSFIWVNYLRICGVPVHEIVSLGASETPYDHFQQLCLNSQIRDTDRLRSNSASCPDNIWGWPGYGLREVGRAMRRLALGRAFQICRQLLTEPFFDNTYTPRSGDVFAAIDREVHRTAWPHIHRYGRVRAIRKTTDGRYVVAYSQTKASAHPVHRLLVARYLHLAVGYPAIHLLPDLQEYRRQTHDFTHVVNAYEAHEHIYEYLRDRGGTLLLRGRGIVASHILQRLYAVRSTCANLIVIHLLRTPKTTGAYWQRARRTVEHHWEFQRFNWPQGTWGGPARLMLARATPAHRRQLLRMWGGTTTTKRTGWRQIVQAGLTEGWYQQNFGTVQRVERQSNGTLVTVIRSHNLPQEIHLEADFIIDATGLTSNAGYHPLLRDLITHYHLPTDGGHLCVADDFELVDLRNGSARVYVSGITAQSGYAPVDSFLGLNYAAQRSIDSLCKVGAPQLQRLHPARSLWQWLRWMRGVAP